MAEPNTNRPNLREAVEKMAPEVKNNMVERYLATRFEQLADNLSNLNVCAQETARKKPFTHATYGTLYEFAKADLVEAAVWDQTYDEWYNQAIMGELDQTKLTGLMNLLVEE